MHGKANGPVSTGDRAVLEALRSNYDMRAHTRGDSRQAGTLTDDFVDRFAIVGLLLAACVGGLARSGDREFLGQLRVEYDAWRTAHP